MWKSVTSDVTNDKIYRVPEPYFFAGFCNDRIKFPAKRLTVWNDNQEIKLRSRRFDAYWKYMFQEYASTTKTRWKNIILSWLYILYTCDTLWKSLYKNCIFETHNKAICDTWCTKRTNCTQVKNIKYTTLCTIDKPHRMRFRHRLPHLTVRSYGAPLKIEGKSIRGGDTSGLNPMWSA